MERSNRTSGRNRPGVRPTQVGVNEAFWRARVFLMGMGEASQGATRTEDMNLGPSHVVVHVVIRGFVTARNRSNRHTQCRQSISTLSKTVSVDETAQISAP